MDYKYKTNGVCAKLIEFTIDNNTVTNIKFTGGCPGNLQMLSKVFDGWKIDDIIQMCKGNTCGFKNTSCANELANALESIKVKI